MAILDKSISPTLWTTSQVGQRLLADTSSALNHHVRRCHGDTLMWAGVSLKSADLMQRCMVRNRFFLSTDEQMLADPPADSLPMHSDLHELPLTNNSIDAVVLHHALEICADPRSALREVARVLHPGGRLVLVALNPWSMLGLRRAYARVARDAFSPVRFANPIRLLDWLSVLGFELEGPVRYVSTGLPFRRNRKKSGVVRKPDALPYSKHEAGGIEIPFADAYILAATKKAYRVLPSRREAFAPPGKLAGASLSRVSAKLVHVDFSGDGR